jgi:hypothetical protein
MAHANYAMLQNACDNGGFDIERGVVMKEHMHTPCRARTLQASVALSLGIQSDRTPMVSCPFVFPGQCQTMPLQKQCRL